MAVDADALRALLVEGPVRVRVALPSGDCWATLRGVRGARVAVSITGVVLRLPLASIRDALPPRGVGGG